MKTVNGRKSWFFVHFNVLYVPPSSLRAFRFVCKGSCRYFRRSATRHHQHFIVRSHARADVLHHNYHCF